MMKVEAGDFEKHKVIKQLEPDDLDVDFEMTWSFFWMIVGSATAHSPPPKHYESQYLLLALQLE